MSWRIDDIPFVLANVRVNRPTHFRERPGVILQYKDQAQRFLYYSTLEVLLEFELVRPIFLCFFVSC